MRVHSLVIIPLLLRQSAAWVNSCGDGSWLMSRVWKVAEFRVLIVRGFLSWQTGPEGLGVLRVWECGHRWVTHACAGGCEELPLGSAVGAARLWASIEQSWSSPSALRVAKPGFAPIVTMRAHEVAAHGYLRL